LFTFSLFFYFLTIGSFFLFPSAVKIQRDRQPFEGEWAFPGGFVDINETLKEAAARELMEETGLKDVKLEQFRSFSALDRDPRHRTVTVVYYGFVNDENNNVKAGSDARNAKWFFFDELPQLAFDHHDILNNLSKFLTRNRELKI
jgi:8-oxo-dGTP diphosphatase